MARKKALKGIHTKPNVWDEAASLEIWRDGEKLDPGANYFVLMFDQMGLPTHWSCEGHPDGFYVMFRGTYEDALLVKSARYFSVEIEGGDYWSIRRHVPDEYSGEAHRIDGLRWAAESWEEKLGPLDFDKVEIVADRGGK